MKVKKLDLPKISDERGDLAFIEDGVGLPFQLKRLLWTYDLKIPFKRGGHIYKTQNEDICVVSGSADLVIRY
ncbi:WxcM-like domain-containing protein [Flavobacterium sp. CS20]|uniref:WxcM-like domain-containing protein n=1 Tax=Flavobacterium sp. CS20 TaxID=2775246 RepID=UPI001B39CF3A|nr:WxcM-like domain-containing protein [Flavobacterium sp. CS20]QTY27702.1 WxcM-like domain-containing protein [Flavobacterium sp. CS20]